MFQCMKCKKEFVGRGNALKHVYQHVAQDEWPVTCPLPPCQEWRGRFPSDYKVHKGTKGHARAAVQFPRIAEVFPVVATKATATVEGMIKKKLQQPLQDLSNLKPRASATSGMPRGKTKVLPRPAPFKPAVRDSSEDSSSSSECDSSLEPAGLDNEVPEYHPTPKELTTSLQGTTLMVASPKEMVLPHTTSVGTPVQDELPKKRPGSPVSYSSPPNKRAHLDIQTDPCLRKATRPSVVSGPAKTKVSQVRVDSPCTTPATRDTKDMTKLTSDSTTSGDRLLRQDLSYHFLTLSRTLVDSQTSITGSLALLQDQVRTVGQQATAMRQQLESRERCLATSQPAVRLRLAGLIDELLCTLAPLHHHSDNSLGFSSQCSLCKQTQESLFHAIDLTDPQLTQPMFRYQGHLKH